MVGGVVGLENPVCLPVSVSFSVPVPVSVRARIQRSGGEVGVFPGEPPVSETGQGRVFVAGTDYPGLATART